jgi:hypothetical protein
VEKKNIFVSMGFPYTEAQREFRAALADLLRSCGVEPRILNYTDFPSSSPAKDISKVMEGCHGVFVVAFERTYFEAGIERKHQETLKSVRYTTPWNQIEAAMAFALKLPIFVLMEPGLRQEGLIDRGFDWYVDEVGISAAALLGQEVRSRIMAWCRDVGSTIAPDDRKIDENTTIGALLRMLTIKTGAILFFFGVGIFGAGILIGQEPTTSTFLLKLIGKSQPAAVGQGAPTRP